LLRAVAEFAPDVVVVPYPGHLLVRGIRAAYDGPLVLDLFLSAYGTIVEDRGMLRPGSLPARMLHRLDRFACNAADLVLMDTAAHASWLCSSMNLAPERVTWVPVSDPDESELVTRMLEPDQRGLLRLLFFGTGVPLHGLDLLIEAVAACPRVALTLIGGSEVDRQRARELLTDRLELLPTFVDPVELRRQIQSAELVAGIFGDSAKASMVLPFKVMHALSMGRAVLTADTPALRQFLRPGVDSVVCPAGSAKALAEVLDQIVDDRMRLPAMGRAAAETYQREFCLARSGAHLCDALESLTGRSFRISPAAVTEPQIPELRV